ncbi:MAG: hypothetical protein L0H73_14115 [Nitrococcus sp.]|nr:hypothetical protein [Nitrococcus sp.]
MRSRGQANAVKRPARIALALLAVILIVLPPSVSRLAAGGGLSMPWLLSPEAPDTLVQVGFSWLIFWAYALAIVLVLAPFLFRLTFGSPSGYRARRTRAFPWWGWAGVGLLLAAWVLAWGGFPTAPSIRSHSFTGLWLGYIVVVNALTRRRAGCCLLTDAPWRLLLLFPASAAFWWMFEYLNQFIGNWHYQHVSELAPAAAIVVSSLPFSTVLPAVVSTRDLLATFPGLSRGLDCWWRPPQLPRRPAAVLALILAMAALGLMAVYPDWLYSFVWLGPLIVITALQTLAGERSLLTPLARGDWAVLWLAALAGLACGFFWELWNWQSLARWSYSVPYVDRFHLFAMPLLGYAGYLPFGLTCIAATRLLTGMEVTPFAVRPRPVAPVLAPHRLQMPKRASRRSEAARTASR